MRVGFSGVPFDPGRLLFGGAAGLEAVARCIDPPGFRKRTSTPEHALASETPTAKSKGLCQTGHGDVRP